jgi:hypothetical protein
LHHETPAPPSQEDYSYFSDSDAGKRMIIRKWGRPIFSS